MSEVTPQTAPPTHPAPPTSSKLVRFQPKHAIRAAGRRDTKYQQQVQRQQNRMSQRRRLPLTQQDFYNNQATPGPRL
jgi:hypothetical protein